MKRIASFAVALLLSVSVHGQTPSSQPTESTDPLLGKLFRSRLDGVAFNPPAGGAKIRELNSGEIVRFVYPDSRWDVRVKPIPLHVPMKLSYPPDAGLLELTAVQLTSNNPTARILRQEVITVHRKHVGLLEANYKAGTDPIFAEQAIFQDTEQHYFSLQMTSRDTPAEQAAARDLFARMMNSVQVLDRSELFREQERRLFKTRGLWVLLDRKAITAALQPLHFMRVVRDGRDVGFIQVNEREAQHNGNDGFEIAIHSQVHAEQNTGPNNGQQPDPSADKTSDNTAAPTGIVIDKPIGPSLLPATRPVGPQMVYTNSTFFVTFDRDHEGWTTISQTDNHVADQVTETAYTDRTMRRRFDPRRARQLQQPTTRDTEKNDGKEFNIAVDNRQPPTIELTRSILDVTYSHGHHQDKPKDMDVPPYYLPQALAQLLPRLLPEDPGQYMFAFYVSGQRQLMNRYVDVESARMVELDGQPVRAIPITDRIGVDGAATTHYVSKGGEWLASIGDDGRLQVFPTDEQTLKGLWPGFAVSTESTDGDTPAN